MSGAQRAGLAGLVLLALFLRLFPADHGMPRTWVMNRVPHDRATMKARRELRCVLFA